MIVIPAIDLKDHQVVRLKQGRMNDSTIYAANPLEMAQKWVSAGATRLHLVDLNGAFDGKPFHHVEIDQIAKAFPQVKLEVGGGIRSLETIRTYFVHGVHFAILGTVAIKNPTLVAEACAAFPGRIILGVDAKNGQVAVEGWDEVSAMPALDLINRFKGLALESVVYTDIAKDGMLAGMNFDSIRQVAAACPFPIIASGGFTRLGDIDELKKIKKVSGVIAGKALYEGKVDLKAALESAAC